MLTHSLPSLLPYILSYIHNIHYIYIYTLYTHYIYIYCKQRNPWNCVIVRSNDNGEIFFISHVSKILPMAVQYTGHVIHVTTILHCYWRKFWWRNTRLYKLSIVFGIILTQFYINFSRQEHQIDGLYVSFKTWDSQVSAYTPFHFSSTVPLSYKTCHKIGYYFLI